MNSENYQEDSVHKNDSTLINFNEMAKITSTPLITLQQRASNSYRQRSNSEVSRRNTFSDTDVSIRKPKFKARSRLLSSVNLGDPTSVFESISNYTKSETDKTKKPTHQEKYASPGLFPVVHLFKNQSSSYQRTPTKIDVKASPVNCPYQSNGSRDFLLGVKHGFPEPTLQNSSCSYNTIPRNVLDALKEISRKRVHSGEDCEITEGKRKKIDFPNDTVNGNNVTSKRQREVSPLLDSLHLETSQPIYKKRCMYDEYTASTSSMDFSCLTTPKKAPVTLKRKTVSTGTDSPQEVKQLKLINAETQTVSTKEFDNDNSTNINKKKVDMAIRIFDDNKLTCMRNQRLAALMGNLARKQTTVLTDEQDGSQTENDTEPPPSDSTKMSTPTSKLTSILSTPKNTSPGSMKHVRFNLAEATTTSAQQKTDQTSTPPTIENSPSKSNAEEETNPPTQTSDSTTASTESAASDSKNPPKSDPPSQVIPTPKTLFSMSSPTVAEKSVGIDLTTQSTSTASNNAAFTATTSSPNSNILKIPTSPPKLGGFSFDLKTGTPATPAKVSEVKSSSESPAVITIATIPALQGAKFGLGSGFTQAPLPSNFTFTEPNATVQKETTTTSANPLIPTTNSGVTTENKIMFPITTSPKATFTFGKPAQVKTEQLSTSSASNSTAFSFSKTAPTVSKDNVTFNGHSTVTTAATSAPAFSFGASKPLVLPNSTVAPTLSESKPIVFSGFNSGTVTTATTAAAAAATTTTTTPFAFGSSNSTTFTSPFGNTNNITTPLTTTTALTNSVTKPSAFTSPFGKPSEPVVSSAPLIFSFQSNKNAVTSADNKSGIIAFGAGPSANKPLSAATLFGSPPNQKISSATVVTSTPTFGAASATPSSGAVFGSSGGTINFSVKQITTTTASTNSLFGAPATSKPSSTSSVFGSATSAFNSSSTTANSLFKATEPSSLSVTTASPFGSKNIFGSSVSTAPSGGFGTLSNSGFNAPSAFPKIMSSNNVTPTFGSTVTTVTSTTVPTFGTMTNTTTNSVAPTFGSGTSSSSPFQFGASKPSFGGFGTSEVKTTPGVFGSGTNSAFAKPATVQPQKGTTSFGSGFGNTNNSAMNVFGSNTGTANAFGNSNMNQPAASAPATNTPFSFTSTNSSTPFGTSPAIKPSFNFTGNAGIAPTFNSGTTPAFGAPAASSATTVFGAPGVKPPNVPDAFGAAPPGAFNIGASTGTTNRPRVTQRAKRRT